MKVGLRRHFKFIKVLTITTCLLVSSCLSQNGSGSGRSKISKGVTTGNNTGGTGGSSGGGTGSAPGNDDIGNTTDQIIENGKVELRHFVDPFDGTYKTKVTIPKNFTGLLYLSGINVTSLANKIVSVRFRFGREKEEVIIPAVISRAPGIIPQTDIEVLIMDMKNRPFERIRLLYDLYDYNDYDSDDDGTDDVEPVLSERDSGLYCRGLALEDDPTFTDGDTDKDGLCDEAGDTCQFAYAKVVDQGLVKNSDSIAINPSEPQIDVAGNGYTSDSAANALKKCLPDANDLNTFLGVLNLSGFTSLDYGVPNNISLDGSTYTYNGPYRPIARDEWEIREAAVFSTTGLFKDILPNAPTSTSSDFNKVALGGIQSFLFPRAGKMSLQANVQHFAATDPYSTSRALDTLVAGGATKYMDGCNIRVSNFDSFTNEGIHSCNVAATVSLITTNIATGEVEEITSSNEVKLQLVRPSVTNFEGKEVLYSSMKTCTNSSACGVNECCFNNRCWGKELVSQCLEDAPTIGNRNIGQTCNTDYDCSSLCCNASTGTCAVHDNRQTPPVLCSKSPGQLCVAREFCRKENVNQCFIVKTGIGPDGKKTCALRCYNVPTFGDCRDGVCVPPTVPEIPTFNPGADDACDEAIDPPTKFQ